MVARLNDKTELAIPLKNLITIIAAVVVGAFGYFNLTERLNFVEHQLELAMIEIEENDNWIDDFKPPENVIEAIKRVRDLEIKIKELEVLVYIGKR
tara:strand:+ start:658 stop:945 length:288 start_codon:yes stop_codon:yes gene_type:complete